MTISQKLLIFIQDRGIKKGWIADYLGISRPTLNQRITDNSWTVGEVVKLNELGVK
jgi:hypothetical protein